MNFYYYTNQFYIIYSLAEAIKRRGKISLHWHFNISDNVLTIELHERLKRTGNFTRYLEMIKGSKKLPNILYLVIADA